MTTFEERSRAIHARIDPFDEDTQVIWAQSGERWLQTDAHATAPSWSRIQHAIAITEPETAKVVARRKVEEEYASEQARLREEQSGLRQAAFLAIALVVLALWLWFLVLLPIQWTR